MEDILEYISCIIIEAQNSSLTQPLSKEWSYVFLMAHNKVSGLDGFLIEFFQDFFIP